MTRRSEDIASDLSLLSDNLEGLPQSLRNVMREGAEQLVALQAQIDRVVTEAAELGGLDSFADGMDRAAMLLGDGQQEGLE